MHALNALIGSVRLVSSSMLVQVRGRGLSLSLAFMLCAVASLCQFDPTEANAHPRTLLRRTVGSELEGRRRFLARPFHTWDVHCLYFTAWPAATYCHIGTLVALTTIDYAEFECLIWTRMSVLSMTTTPMYRICHLMKLFHIEARGVLVQDTLLQIDTLTWDDCYFDVRNETKPPENCTGCNIALVCATPLHYLNGPDCVTKAEGNIDVEYCYEKDKVNATEASKRCAEKSSALVEIEELPRTLHEALANDPILNWEFWVDLKKEDVSKLAGVVAFDVDDIDWNMPCVTVWFGAWVPWFYKRNCSQLYPVMCENSTYTKSGPIGNTINAEVYCADVPSKATFCLLENGTFNKKAASEFCANRRLLLLTAKLFYEIHTIYFVWEGPFVQWSYPRYVYWDARSTSSRQDSINECLAVELESDTPQFYFPFPQYNRIPRNCSEELGYVSERVVQTIENKLRKSETGDSQTQIARVLFQYRPTPQNVTGRAPCEPLLGRMVKTPLDVLNPYLRSTAFNRPGMCTQRSCKDAFEDTFLETFVCLIFFLLDTKHYKIITATAVL
ncbi:uncharacterized protein LOC142570401 [Dermacentor variabilis]|uniref:uncharacterized protein LOC142570401 n=1 Tax=Dermacentor variabilis TaxID=34621 RepID=UPI003F5C6F75